MKSLNIPGLSSRNPENPNPEILPSSVLVFEFQTLWDMRHMSNVTNVYLNL